MSKSAANANSTRAVLAAAGQAQSAGTHYQTIVSDEVAPHFALC
jgi:hydroxymethylglutaryl-CoA reductase